MKKIFAILTLLLQGMAGHSQRNTSDSSLKSPNQVLPRWAIDINYRPGALNQEIEPIDFAQAYSPNNLAFSSRYTTPVFTNGRGHGGDIQLSYFFNKRRTLGVGIGALYMRYTGTTTLDTFRSDYQEEVNPDSIYRQIITSKTPFQEDVTITTLSIPLLLKFKYQFGTGIKPSPYGFTVEAGPVFGINNKTIGNASGVFNYEAVYKISQETGAKISGFDNRADPKGDSSFLMLEKTMVVNRDAQAHLDSLRNQGFNVGLNKSIAPSQRNQEYNDYTALSIGAMVQLGFTYQLTYNVTFRLSGYYMYQSWLNEDNEGYRFVDKVVQEGTSYYSNYRPITGAYKKSDYSSYGASIGFRIFFGEKRDTDGDGFSDAVDDCPKAFGTKFRGCPDSDNDGTPDRDDSCPTESGDVATQGCPDPDGDGIYGSRDRCPDVFGEMRDGCPINERYVLKDTTLERRDGTPLPDYDVLDTTTLHFAFGKADIRDSVAEILDHAVKLLNKKADYVIYIGGHTDDVGARDANLLLSIKRANAAHDYLVGKGISDSRIILGGNGEDKPANPNDSDENRAKNRRIEMKLLRPVGNK